MFRYLIRRLLWAMVLFIAVTFVTYIIFFLVPADPAALAAGKTATPEKIAEAEKFLGLDEPDPHPVREVPEAAGRRPVARLLVHEPQSVNDEILRAAPITASLVFGGDDPRDPDLDPDRDLLGAEAAIADRQSGDGVRPDRDLPALVLDRAGALVPGRLQAGLDTDRWLLRSGHPSRRPRTVAASPTGPTT